MNEQQVFSWLGVISSWVVSGAIGAGLFRFLGQKWLENIFSKDLEAFKAQKLHEFDLLLTRKTKWHDKEHEVLSTSWIKLIQAYNALKRSIGLLRQMPDLNNMKDEEFEKFIARNEFSDSEKDYLTSNESTRNHRYGRILDFRDLREARNLFSEFHKYFEEHKIFLQPDIKDKFMAMDDFIWNAWVDRQMSFEDEKISFTRQARQTIKEKIDPLLIEIENIIQQKLFSENPMK